MNFKNLLKEWQNKKSFVNEISQAAIDTIQIWGERKIVPLEEDGIWETQLIYRLRRILQNPYRLLGKQLSYTVDNEYGGKTREVSVAKWANKLSQIHQDFKSGKIDEEKYIKYAVNLGVFYDQERSYLSRIRDIPDSLGVKDNHYRQLLELKKRLSGMNFNDNPRAYRTLKSEIAKFEKDTINTLPIEYVVDKYMLELNGESGEAENYIMISQNPVDVLRMSDIHNLGTCHSEKSSHFKSAVQAATRGEQIAYVLTKDSVEALADNMGLNSIDVDEINSRLLETGWVRKELIPDPCRNVDAVPGFVPRSRLRYRPFTIFKSSEHYDDRIEIQVPYQSAIKGDRVKGFSEALLKLAVEQYRDELEDFLDIMPSEDDEGGDTSLKLHARGLHAVWTGGEYEDEYSDKLLWGFLEACFPEVDTNWSLEIPVEKSWDEDDYVYDEYTSNRLWQNANNILRQANEYLKNFNTEILKFEATYDDNGDDYMDYGDPRAGLFVHAEVNCPANPNWSKNVYDDESDFVEIIEDHIDAQDLEMDGRDESILSFTCQTEIYYMGSNDDFSDFNHHIKDFVDSLVEYFSTEELVYKLFSEFDKDMGQIILPFNFLERLPRMYWRSTADQEGEAALEEMFKPVLEKENKIMKKSFRDLEKKGISFHFIVDPFYVGEEITKEQINLKIRGTSDATNICIKLSEQSLVRYVKFIQNNLDKIKATIFHFMKKRYESVNNLEAFKADRERIEIGINNLLHSHEEKMKKYIVELYQKLELDQDEEDEEDY